MLTLLLHATAIATTTPAGCDVSFEQQQNILSGAVGKLVKQGWKAEHGTLHFRASDGVYGQNAQSKYGRYKFKEAGILGLPIFTLGDADAVVWVGCTPPPCEYFSMRSYLKGSSGAGCPLVGCDILGSLGDAANNLRFNTTGGSRSPNNFNRTTAMITTGDLGTGAKVAGALTSAGLPSGAINWDWMPPSLLHMSPPDILKESYLLLYRMTIFHDEAAGKAYTDADYPIIRLVAPKDTPRSPSPVPTQLPRGTGTNESHLEPSLSKAQDGAKKVWGAKGYVPDRVVQLGPIDIEGILDCVPHKTSCGGDVRDAAYMSDYTASYTLPSDASAFLLVIGVNHNVTKKATRTETSSLRRHPQTKVSSTCRATLL
jgi:hypothetical protein